MSVSAKAYGKFIDNRFRGGSTVNLATNSLKVALLTSSYTPDYDVDAVLADVVLASNEVAIVDANYATGGKAIGGTTFVYSAGIMTLDGNDVVWATSTISNARYAVVYDDTVAAKPLVGLVDFGTDVSDVNGTFTITWDAAGILAMDFS